MKSSLTLAAVVGLSGPAIADSRMLEFHRPGAVISSHDTLVIRGTLLTEKTVNEAIAHLEAKPDIRSLWLMDIPGGIHIPSARLAWRAQELDVFVAGGCYSGCARVALSGRTLTLTPLKGQLPAALVVHGSFGTTTGQWSSRSLQQANFYVERLPTISRADIEQALSFTRPNGAGLFIFEDPTTPGAEGHSVLLCESFPSRCRSLPADLDGLKIRRAAVPLPDFADAERRIP